MRHTAYDVSGNVTTNFDLNGVWTRYSFDPLGRILSTENYSGAQYFGYTTNVGGATSHTNELNEVSLFAYDLYGNKTNECVVGASTNGFIFSAAGDLLKLIDAEGHLTTWSYDEYGLVRSKRDHNGAEMFRYSYDANGRLTNRWTPAKLDTRYAYDEVGNLTLVDYAANVSLEYRYDAANRLTNMVDATGATVFSHTAFGALASVDGPWEADTVTYQYETGPRLQKVSLAQPNASPWLQSFAYDGNSRLRTVSSPAGEFTYEYLPGEILGQPTPGSLVKRLLLPSQAYVTNAFDPLGRQLGTWLRNSADAILNGHEYLYDPASRRTNQVRLTTASGLVSNSVSYTYDRLGQLESSTRQDTKLWPRHIDDFGYAYDAAGNLRYRTNGYSLQTFNVNNLNQLTTYGRNGFITLAGSTTGGATNVMVNDWGTELYSDGTFTTDGYPANDGTNILTAVAHDNYGRWATNTVTVYLPANVSFTYDLNGNLLFDGRRHFVYDLAREIMMLPIGTSVRCSSSQGSATVPNPLISCADENQLISVAVSNQWRSWFAYDGKMRRRVRTEATWNGTGWITNEIVRYIYNGKLVVQERHYSPALPNIPQQVVTYTRGKDLSGTLEGAGGIGGLLARTDGLASTLSHAYYHADGNGNVTMLLSEQQLPVARYLYDPFGNTLAASGPLAEANLYRFSSKEWHLPSGLVYYLYRYYDPGLQRWLNRDPIQEWGGINLYGFVVNRPTGRIDLFGLSPAGDYPGWGGPPLPPGLQGPTIPSKGNCWRYACKDPRKPGEDHSPFPAPGGDPGGTVTCDQLKNGAKAFGAKDPNQDGNCPAGYYKVKLVLQPPSPTTGWNDYHWYRQDDDGTWSSKPGSGCVESAVKDPTGDARRRGYPTDCGNLCIPNPGIDVDKGKTR